MLGGMSADVVWWLKVEKQKARHGETTKWRLCSILFGRCVSCVECSSFVAYDLVNCRASIRPAGLSCRNEGMILYAPVRRGRMVLDTLAATTVVRPPLHHVWSRTPLPLHTSSVEHQIYAIHTRVFRHAAFSHASSSAGSCRSGISRVAAPAADPLLIDACPHPRDLM